MAWVPASLKFYGMGSLSCIRFAHFLLWSSLTGAPYALASIMVGAAGTDAKEGGGGGTLAVVVGAGSTLVLLICMGSLTKRELERQLQELEGEDKEDKPLTYGSL